MDNEKNCHTSIRWFNKRQPNQRWVCGHGGEKSSISHDCSLTCAWLQFTDPILGEITSHCGFNQSTGPQPFLHALIGDLVLLFKSGFDNTYARWPNFSICELMLCTEAQWFVVDLFDLIEMLNFPSPMGRDARL